MSAGSVTQGNVKVLGDAPAPVLGTLYQATATALGLAVEDATSEDAQAMIMDAATTEGTGGALLAAQQLPTGDD